MNKLQSFVESEGLPHARSEPRPASVFSSTISVVVVVVVVAVVVVVVVVVVVATGGEREAQAGQAARARLQTRDRRDRGGRGRRRVSLHALPSRSLARAYSLLVPLERKRRRSRGRVILSCFKFPKCVRLFPLEARV